MDTFDFDAMTFLIDTTVLNRLSPDQDDFDPAEPLEAYPDDATMSVCGFMALPWHNRITD